MLSDGSTNSPDPDPEWASEEEIYMRDYPTSDHLMMDAFRKYTVADLMEELHAIIQDPPPLPKTEEGS